MDKNLLETKIKNGKMGKNASVSNLFQKMFNNFMWEETTSSNQQFMYSNSKNIYRLHVGKNNC